MSIWGRTSSPGAGNKLPALTPEALTPGRGNGVAIKDNLGGPILVLYRNNRLILCENRRKRCCIVRCGCCLELGILSDAALEVEMRRRWTWPVYRRLLRPGGRFSPAAHPSRQANNAPNTVVDRSLALGARAATIAAGQRLPTGRADQAGTQNFDMGQRHDLALRGQSGTSFLLTPKQNRRRITVFGQGIRPNKGSTFTAEATRRDRRLKIPITKEKSMIGEEGSAASMHFASRRCLPAKHELSTTFAGLIGAPVTESTISVVFARKIAIGAQPARH